MIIILSIFAIWYVIGFYFSRKANNIFKYYLHMKYTLVNKSIQKNDLFEKFSPFLAGIMGPFAYFLVMGSYAWGIPEKYKKEAWDSKTGEIYWVAGDPFKLSKHI